MKFKKLAFYVISLMGSSLVTELYPEFSPLSPPERRTLYTFILKEQSFLTKAFFLKEDLSFILISGLAWGAFSPFPSPTPPQHSPHPLSKKSSLSHSAQFKLTSQERESLRFHLENLHSEVDLLFRNQRAHDGDFKKLNHELMALKVFERIPFTADLGALKEELQQSSSAQWVEISEVRFLDSVSKQERIPEKRATQDPPLILKENQFVRRIPFQVIALGKKNDLLQWMKSVKVEQMRLVEWDRTQLEQSLSEIAPGKWKIHGHAFQFLKVKYPHLEPKKPKTYLPAWARKNPWRFAQQEPILWDLILKTEAKLPQSPSLYEQRGEFKLNEARLSFFLSKT